MLELENRLRTVAGDPGRFLPNVKGRERKELRELIKACSQSIPLELLLRAYVSARVTPPPDLLQADTINRAFDRLDLPKIVNLLTFREQRVDASAWLCAARYRFELEPGTNRKRESIRLLGVLRRWTGRLAKRGVVLTGESSVELMKLLVQLAGYIGEGGRKTASSRPLETIFELGIGVASTATTLEPWSLLEGLVRTLNRAATNGIVERMLRREDISSRVHDLRSSAFGKIAQIMREGRTDLLENLLSPHTLLRSDKASVENQVLEVWRREGDSLPEATRRWVLDTYGQQLDERPVIELVDEGESARVLALASLLLVSWSERDEAEAWRSLRGSLRAYAERFMSLRLVGSEGEICEFDPELHEAEERIEAGQLVRLVRPGIEHRGARRTRVIIRALVERTSPLGKQ